MEKVFTYNVEKKSLIFSFVRTYLLNQGNLQIIFHIKVISVSVFIIKKMFI